MASGGQSWGGGDRGSGGVGDEEVEDLRGLFKEDGSAFKDCYSACGAWALPWPER